MSHEQLDVDDRDELRCDRSYRRRSDKCSLLRAERIRHVIYARAVDNRQFRDAWTVRDDAGEVADDYVKWNDTLVEAAYAFWRPREHHLLDGDQQQIPGGDVDVSPEEELAVPEPTQEGARASGPRYCRPTEESVAEGNDDGVQDNLMT